MSRIESRPVEPSSSSNRQAEQRTLATASQQEQQEQQELVTPSSRPTEGTVDDNMLERKDTFVEPTVLSSSATKSTIHDRTLARIDPSVTPVIFSSHPTDGTSSVNTLVTKSNSREATIRSTRSTQKPSITKNGNIVSDIIIVLVVIAVVSLVLIGALVILKVKEYGEGSTKNSTKMLLNAFNGPERTLLDAKQRKCNFSTFYQACRIYSFGVFLF